MTFKLFFQDIAKAEHSTVAWLEKELVAFEAKAPSIEKVVDAGLAYVGPLLQLLLVGINEPALAKLVGDGVTKAQNDLAAASALITDFGPTPTAVSIFTAVEDNLGGILKAIQVSNPTSVGIANKVVSEVGLLGDAVQVAFNAIEAALTSPQAATPAA